MKSRKLGWLLLFFSFLYCGSSIAADKRHHLFVVSGVVINSGNAKVINEFVNFLSSQSDYLMTAHFVKNYEELSDTLRQHPDAIAWTCSLPFVEDHINDGQQLIAVPLFNNKPLYHSLILTRSNRKEKNLLDFKDQVIAYSDPRSNSGYLSPSHALFQAGFTINEFFRVSINANTHEGSIEAVRGGLADVAAIDEYIWVEYLKQHPEAKQELKELERMGPYPFTPIVAGSRVTQDEIDFLAHALTNMSHNRQGKHFLSIFGLNGFVLKDVSFFDPIKSIAQQLKEG